MKRNQAPKGTTPTARNPTLCKNREGWATRDGCSKIRTTQKRSENSAELCLSCRLNNRSVRARVGSSVSFSWEVSALSMFSAKPTIFTIHGIYTEGPWQSGAAAVLDPFFRHHPLKYEEYRRWAILKLAADVIIAMACVCLGFVLVHLGFLHGPWPLGLYALAALAAVMIAHSFARRFRTAVMMKLYEQMTKIAGNGPPPSIIAHSLGTYLVGSALRHFQDWSCHAIILTGCVLRRRFPWATMKNQFHYVSNEVAHMDPVPIAATFLSVSVPDMGCAGMLGFKGDLGQVHNVLPNSPNPNCQGKQCMCDSHNTTPRCNATVHNIHHRFLRHSDYFRGKNHAWKAWLPALWGYDPVLYRSFIEACQRCHRLETQNGLFSDQNEAATILKKGCWGWTYGTLEQFVLRELGAELRATGRKTSPQRLNRLTDIIISNLWATVSEAAAESDRPEDRRGEVLEHLNPRNALKRCIAATLQFT